MREKKLINRQKGETPRTRRKWFSAGPPDKKMEKVFRARGASGWNATSIPPDYWTGPRLVQLLMSDLEQTCASLRAQIAATEEQLAGLKRELQIAEEAAAKSKAQAVADDEAASGRRWPLLDEEYRRYGRQMIVPQLGIQGLQPAYGVSEICLANLSFVLQVN